MAASLARTPQAGLQASATLINGRQCRLGGHVVRGASVDRGSASRSSTTKEQLSGPADVFIAHSAGPKTPTPVHLSKINVMKSILHRKRQAKQSLQLLCSWAKMNYSAVLDIEPLKRNTRLCISMDCCEHDANAARFNEKNAAQFNEKAGTERRRQSDLFNYFAQGPGAHSPASCNITQLIRNRRPCISVDCCGHWNFTSPIIAFRSDLLLAAMCPRTYLKTDIAIVGTSSEVRC